jgi:hypothetical protein
MSADSPLDEQSWYGAAPLRADTETVAPGVALIRISGDLDIDTCVAASERIRAQITPPAEVVADAVAAGRRSGSTG